MKHLLLLLLLLVGLYGFTQQPWMEELNIKKGSELNFFEIQKKFYDKYGEEFSKEESKEKDSENEEDEILEHFKRWEYEWESQVNADGTFPTQKQYDIANKQYYSGAKSASGSWQNMGLVGAIGGYEGNRVGKIDQVAFHPTDKNVFWVASTTGGLWKTTDGGSTWNVLTDYNDIITCTTVAVPSDYVISNTLYIGNEVGVFKSTDGGVSWNITGLEFELDGWFSTNKVVVNPSKTNIVYALTTEGLYKTADGGSNWSCILRDFSLFDIEFNLADPSIFYVGNSDGQIYRFTNDGSNYKVVYDKENEDAKEIRFAVTPDNTSVVYAVVADKNDGLFEVLKSTNSGVSFSTIYTPASPPTTSKPNLLCSKKGGDYTGGQGGYCLSMAVDPTDENIIYVGGINTWKSVDGGNTWNIVTYWLPGYGVPSTHADKQYFAFNGNTLYDCNDGGMVKTIDGGDSWSYISRGIVNSQMYKLGVSQSDSRVAIAGLQDNGTKSRKSDGSWHDVVSGDGMDCAIDYVDHNIQYGSSQYGRFRRTKDMWSSSEFIKPSSAEDGAWVTPIVIDKNSHNTIYIGYVNFWKSTDNGDSWEKITILDNSKTLRSLNISSSNSQYIYVATSNKVWRTVDGGDTWNDITSDLKDKYITGIEIKDDDPNTVWVSLGRYNSDAVYETTDGGETWTNISDGLPEIPVYTIVQNTQNTSEVELYAGTNYGVYVKVGSDNWKLFNNGMPKVKVKDLEIYYDDNPVNSKILAATYGRGMWKSDLYSVVEAPPVANFTATPITIYEGETVRFIDQSSNSPTSWSWDFGDGASSDAQNPVHTYSSEGTYSVSLTVTNSYGSDIETKNSYIVVNKSDIDNIPPTIISTIPVNGATDVALDTKISITFSEAMNESTVTVSGITEIGRSWNENTLTVSHETLSDETVYTLVVNGKDVAGNSMPEYTFIFVTSNDTSVSIQNVSNHEIRIYPNPVTSKYVYIVVDDISEKTEVQLYNSTGVMVKTQSIVSRLSKIDIQDLDSGIYVVRVVSHKYKQIIKLYIE